MNVIITGRHMELTENLKKYAEEKMKKFNKYSGNITEATVTLGVEKYRHKAEVLLKINGMQIQAESITGEMYSSIDDVVEKLEHPIR
ncbi:MAG: ribosome-associated translation inhibitor RaiA [Nitrospirae bacterium]|nr:ribosome-associated translation inhibitor RaiA [Nitrospirota bacterium]